MTVTIVPNSPTIIRSELDNALINENTFSAGVRGPINNGNTLAMTIVTPAAPIKVGLYETSVNVESSCNILFVENPTVNAAGSAVTSFNIERSSLVPASSTLRKDDTFTGGTDLTDTLVNAGEEGKATGGSEGTDRGWILKTSTAYILQLTNTSGVTADLVISFRFLEET